MADTQSRQAKRTPVTLKIKFKSETLDQFIERYSVDISHGGIFIRTKDPLAVGTTLKFEFQLKDASPLIRGEGTVVWTRDHDPNRSGVAPGMGVRFDRLPPESQEILDRILTQKAAQGAERSKTNTGQFGDSPTRVAPAPLVKGLAKTSGETGPILGKAPKPGGFVDERTDSTPLPTPMPFHTDAGDFSDDVFEEKTRVADLDALVHSTADPQNSQLLTEVDEDDATFEMATNVLKREEVDALAAGSRLPKPPGPPKAAEEASAKPAAKPAPTPEPKAATATEPEPATGATAEHKPTPEAQSETKSEPETETKPETEAGPAPEPQPETETDEVAAKRAEQQKVVSRAKGKGKGKPPARVAVAATEPSPAVAGDTGGEISGDAAAGEERQSGGGLGAFLLVAVLLLGVGGYVVFGMDVVDLSRFTGGSPDDSGTTPGASPAELAEAPVAVPEPEPEEPEPETLDETQPEPDPLAKLETETATEAETEPEPEPEPAFEPVAVFVKSKTPGAIATLLDSEVEQSGPTPLKLEGLNPEATYVVEVSKPGFVSDTVEFQPSDKPIIVKLQEKPRVVVIESEPDGAAVLINGRKQGSLTPAEVALEGRLATARSLRVSVRKRGFRSGNKVVKVSNASFDEGDEAMTLALNIELEKLEAVAATPPRTPKPRAPKPRAKPDKTAAKSPAKADSKPDTKADSKPDTKADSKPDTKPDTESVAKAPEKKPATEKPAATEPKPAEKPEPKPAEKPADDTPVVDEGPVPDWMK